MGLLEENAVRYLMATGWGKLSWDHGTSLERAFIHDPPCPKGGTAAGNQIIEGLVAGLAEGLRGKRFSVVEDHYDSSRRALTIGMVEAMIATKMERPEARTVKVDNDLVENEVRRISNSLENLAKPPEILEVTVPIQSGRLNVALEKKEPAPQHAVEDPARALGQPRVAENPIKTLPPQNDHSYAEMEEQKKKLEQRTQELERMLKEVEGSISKTKEEIVETESVGEALDNAALLAQKYVSQAKLKKKKPGRPAYLDVLKKKAPGKIEEEDIPFVHDEDSI